VKTGGEKTLRLYTIGHSNYSFEEFLSLLKAFDIGLVADVRRYPSSRRFPHFNSELFRKLLDQDGICYVWLEALGGRRHTGAIAKSSNIGLRVAGFRNYADHMGTDDFHAGVQELLSTALTARTVIMCAEKSYWKCHRRLLSDYLVARGVEVIHILGAGKSCGHELTPSAVVTGDATVRYPLESADEKDGAEFFRFLSPS
jgi:uncharacterized protein (DUF488 family)